MVSSQHWLIVLRYFECKHHQNSVLFYYVLNYLIPGCFTWKYSDFISGLGFSEQMHVVHGQLLLHVLAITP